MWHKWEPIPQKEPSLYTLLKSNVFLRERVGIVFENQSFKDGKISRPFWSWGQDSCFRKLR